MQPHDPDDGIRRDHPPGSPTDVTADEPKPADGPLPDLEIRARPPSGPRVFIFTAGGAAAGYALMALLMAGCHAAEAASGMGQGAWAPHFERLLLVFAGVGGGFVGLLLALAWRRRPRRPPSND